jgi:hypothetical protein
MPIPFRATRDFPGRTIWTYEEDGTPDGRVKLWNGQSTDPNLDIALGLVEGATIKGIVGYHPGLSGGAGANFQTVWDQTGLYTYLTGNTQLFVSSSSAADVGITIIVFGLDFNLQEVVGLAVLNGQNQVPLNNPNFFRIEFSQTIGTTTPLQGDVYVAVSDPAPGGIPAAPGAIKDKIRIGIEVSKKLTYTVPANKIFVFDHNFTGTGKDSDIDYQFLLRTVTPGVGPDQTFKVRVEVSGYQSSFFIFNNKLTLLGGGSEFEVRVKSSKNNATFNNIIEGILIDE